MNKVLNERDKAHDGSAFCTFRADDVAASQEFRHNYDTRRNVISAEEMPFERSADGLIKHIVHNKLNTKECCVEAYMQFLAGGARSGRHRHMWEEVIFVVEGSGYDLHWDLKYDCIEWTRGDFIYVPPFTIHQHFNASPNEEARLIVISNRIVKEMGYDWFDQLDNAPGF
jgi:uncharacterized RmlC-like cupin family protein